MSSLFSSYRLKDVTLRNRIAIAPCANTPPSTASATTGIRCTTEAIALTRNFKQSGLDLLNVSMGFSTPTAQIPWRPALLAPITERVSREAALPVASSWNIDDPQ